MSYTILNRNGKPIAVTGDRKYADYYSKYIGGSVKKNPAATFGRQAGSASDRKNLFGQYSSIPSFVWARETIQNAVDNKATNVVFSTTRIQSGRYAGCVLARIVDNGTGMDLKTLQEKFLTIGGTGKGARGEETGTVGGFGEAKKVVLLAWQAWRVITKREDAAQAILAEAVEGWENYNYDYITPPRSIARRGTIVEVISWPESQYQISTADAKNFISYCDLPSVTFSVLELLAQSGSLLSGDFAYNTDKEDVLYLTSKGKGATSGQESIAVIGGFTDKIANFELGNAKTEFEAAVEDDKGNVTVRKCAKLYYRRFGKEDRKYSTPRIFYRVKGLYLWSTWTKRSVNGNVIIDFTIKTTLVLSDNRDSIRNVELREKIEEWLINLVSDPSNVLRGYSKTRTMVFEGSASQGSLQAPTKPAAIAAAQKIAEIQIHEPSATKAKKDKEIDAIAEQVAEKIVKIEAAMPVQSPICSAPEVVREIIKYEAKTDKDQTTLQKAIERAMFVPEYVLHIEDDLAEEGFKIPEKFNPEKLTQDLKKLIAVWAEMIRLTFMMKGTDLTYAVGFVFSEECLGLFAPKKFFPYNHVTERDGLSADGAILLNPYYFDKNERKQIVDVSNPEHLEAIWATCVHECTHMIDCVGEHDEAFASCLTRNVGYVARVYPLVEVISEIVQTTEPLARAKFARGLDVEEYLSRDRKRGRKPKTAREKNLEKFATELASKLASTGSSLPDPSEYDVDLPPSVWQAIRESSKLAEGGAAAGNLVSEMTIRNLRKKLKEAEEKLQQPRPALPAPKSTRNLFKKYN